MGDELTDEQIREAAAGDLNTLAVLMLVGSTAFALLNRWAGTMNWLGVALSISSTLAWSLGLWQRSPIITSFVEVGFGVSGLVAPVVGVAGIVAGVLGFAWGWALVAGAVVYVGFSVLGLEIIERAKDTGIVEPYTPE